MPFDKFKDLADALQKRSGQNQKLDAHWAAIADTYKPKARLGKGSSGEVILARRRADKELVAIKYIPEVEHDHFYLRVAREISIMRSLSAMPGNSASVQLLEVIQSRSKTGAVNTFLVMEYIPMTLQDILTSQDMLSLTEAEVSKILGGLLEALAFLHSAGVIHRDIKPGNILVTPDLQVRLCDFGLARTLKNARLTSEPNLPSGEVSAGPGNSRLTQHVQTRYYRAPEVILLQEYGFAADVWSVGCVLSEMLLSSQPYMKTLDSSYSSRILFKGAACYPLSPKSGNREVDQRDQLAVILEVLGKQSNDDLAGFRPKVKEYIRKVEALHENTPVDFGNEFPSTSQKLIHTLEETLKVDSKRRASAASLAAHISGGEEPAVALFELELAMDEPGAFDYITYSATGKTIDDLREMLRRVVSDNKWSEKP